MKISRVTRASYSRRDTPRRTISGLVLGAGFSLTGAGTVMLGVLLPVLGQKWGMRDDAAGYLFLLQFSGSALGAVFTGSNRVFSLMRGYGLLAASSCALAFAGPNTAFAFFFCFGLGLGMTMTATSLLFSDRWSNDRAAKLEALNFAWSAGAAAAPMLMLPFLEAARLRLLFLVMLGLFLLLFAWVSFCETRGRPHIQGEETQLPSRAFPACLLPLLILAVLSVGVEASLSGWLTTYSHRAAPQGMARAALATTLFWLGVVLSRLAFSTRILAKVGRYAVLHGTLWGVAASVALLIGTHSSTLILVASGISGLCLGPVYPLVLSYLLERSARGWIFAVAGTGSAVFPWMTGLLSAYFGSLRYGLIAPCCAVALAIFLRWVGFRWAADELAPPSRL